MWIAPQMYMYPIFPVSGINVLSVPNDPNHLAQDTKKDSGVTGYVAGFKTTNG